MSKLNAKLSKADKVDNNFETALMMWCQHYYLGLDKRVSDEDFAVRIHGQLKIKKYTIESARIEALKYNKEMQGIICGLVEA